MSINWTRFAEIVQENESFVLTSHMRPDCDALGSELAMAMALKSLGKKVRIVNGDTIPPHLAFIDVDSQVEVLGRDVTASDFSEFDVFMVLDTSAWGQLGPMGDLLRNFTGQKVVVDHHISEDQFGAESFKETTAEANGRLVLEAIEFLQVPLTKKIADALFAAIATDTGWFRFPSVNEKTFVALSKIVAAGAEPATVFGKLYEQHSLSRIQLQGKILSGVTPALDGRVMFSKVTQADLKETGAAMTDTEDVINRLLTVRGVEVALLFSELDSTDGPSTKVSLRSRGKTDVRQIAEQFGGGGHNAASGVRCNRTLNETVSAILDAVTCAMR